MKHESMENVADKDKKKQSLSCMCYTKCEQQQTLPLLTPSANPWFGMMSVELHPWENVHVSWCLFEHLDPRQTREN